MLMFVIFGAVLLLMLLGVSTAVTMGFASIATFLFAGGDPTRLFLVPQRMFAQVSGITLMSIPFFLLMGNLMTVGGVSKSLFGFGRVCLGHRWGGLSNAAIVACVVMAAMSGNSLFAAGAVPGLLLGIMFMGWSSWVSARRNYAKTEPAPWRERLQAFREAFFALMTPVIVMGGMFGGIFTATEAAAVASLYVMFLGFFVYGTLRVRDLPAIFWNTVEQTAKVMFVIATAGFFQYVLLYTRIPQQAIAFMSTSFATAAPVLLLIIALLVLMGCFMEGTAILLITVPIFVPLAKSFGYDIVQLGIVMCISLAIGVLTPPVGLNLYVMSSITGEHVLAIAKEAVGYVLIMIIVAILVAFIPELSLGFAKWVP